VTTQPSAHLASVEQAQPVNRLIGNHLDLEE
jgi:hypothetical protein